jgi:hypothetical protein
MLEVCVRLTVEANANNASMRVARRMLKLGVCVRLTVDSINASMRDAIIKLELGVCAMLRWRQSQSITLLELQ